MATTATSLKWVPIPNADKDAHAQVLGAFAVDVYNQQNHAHLKFLQAVKREELDRGSEHYTYRLIIKVMDGSETRLYWCEVLQDLSAPSQPPVLNLGSFAPVSHLPWFPTWSDVPDAPNDRHLHHLALFAVEIYNKQNHAALKLLQVVGGLVLDRGTDHYTYHLMIMVLDNYLMRYFKIEVFQDLSGHGQPPVINLGGRLERRERLSGRGESIHGLSKVAEHLAEDYKQVLDSSCLPGERGSNLRRIRLEKHFQSLNPLVT
ncbi:unnamed protein product [Victoria cruziana]